MAAIDLTPPSEPPRLTVLACGMYERNGSRFEVADIRALQEELDEICDDNNAIFWELVGLEALSRKLGMRGDAVSRDQIIELLRAQLGRFPDLVREATGLGQDRAEAVLDSATPLIGTASVQKKAPRYDEAAPSGTTRLSELASQRRVELRPRRTKPLQ